MGIEFTENTVERFLAQETKCIWCGEMIKKSGHSYLYRNEKNDHLIRRWPCPNCPAYYEENQTRLKEVGLL